VQGRTRKGRKSRGGGGIKSSHKKNKEGKKRESYRPKVIPWVNTDTGQFFTSPKAVKKGKKVKSRGTYEQLGGGEKTPQGGNREL